MTLPHHLRVLRANRRRSSRGGTARVPERIETTSTLTGVRTERPEAADGSVPVESSGSLDGDLVGGLTSTDTRSDQQVVEDAVFTDTIDGIGTLTLRVVTDNQGFDAVSVAVLSGTDDFAGPTGSGTTSIDGGAEPTGPFTARFDL